MSENLRPTTPRASAQDYAPQRRLMAACCLSGLCFALDAAAADYQLQPIVTRNAQTFSEITLNSGAAERFVHGQDVMVFRSGAKAPDVESKVVLRGVANRLLGIGTVRAVLARGRTLNIAPSMVLDTPTAAPTQQKK